MCLTSRRRRRIFKDRIEFDEPTSLEEAIRKLKNCYEQSKHRYETKLG